MFIELVDRLRCVRPHADSWLVASADRMHGRHIVAGTLGCPVCRAEYPVRDGAAHFDADAARPPAAEAPEPPAPDDLLRAAALLGLAEPGGFVLLTGEWAPFAAPLAAATGAHVVLLNPAGPALPAGEGASVVYAAAGTLPLSAGSLRAAALPAEPAPSLADLAVAALAPRGRLVAPADAPLPAGVVELARDARHWVAETAGATSAPVPLARARRPR